MHSNRPKFAGRLLRNTKIDRKPWVLHITKSDEIWSVSVVAFWSLPTHTEYSVFRSISEIGNDQCSSIVYILFWRNEHEKICGPLWACMLTCARSGDRPFPSEIGIVLWFSRRSRNRCRLSWLLDEKNNKMKKKKRRKDSAWKLQLRRDQREAQWKPTKMTSRNKQLRKMTSRSKRVSPKLGHKTACCRTSITSVTIKKKTSIFKNKMIIWIMH